VLFIAYVLGTGRSCQVLSFYKAVWSASAVVENVIFLLFQVYGPVLNNLDTAQAAPRQCPITAI